MATYSADGKVKVGWVTTLSSTTSPTAVQITAGVDLENNITPDGLDLSSSQAKTDTTSLASTFNTYTPGRTDFDAELTLALDDSSTTVYDALKTPGTAGYLVVRYGVATTTDWTAAQKVDVYPATLGRSMKNTVAANELQTYRVPLFITATPSFDSTVA
jgi:hypothetical protein